MIPYGVTGLHGHWWVNTYCTVFNSLAPGRFGCNFKNSIFKLALLIGTFRASFDKVLRWMIQDLTDDKSTLVQVMAWCRQATSHHLSQCWPRSMSPYGVIRPQWVNSLALGRCDYRKISNMRHTKSQNSNDSHLVLKSSLPNPLKPGVKSRMKM